MANDSGFKPWYALALGGGALAFALIASGRKGRRPSFSGPAEGFAGLEDENLCAPGEPAGTSAFRNFVTQNFGGSDLGISRACAAAPSGHYSGRSWDWGTLTNNARPDALFRYLFANNAEALRRAGITYLIYNQQIWNTRSQVWQPYNGPNPHTDHVHISFSTPGSLGQTSFYRGRAIA